MVHGQIRATLAMMMVGLAGCSDPEETTEGSFSVSLPMTQSGVDTTVGGSTTGTGGSSTGPAVTSSGDVPTEPVSPSTGIGGCVEDSDCLGDPDGPLCNAGVCTTSCLAGDTRPCYTGALEVADVGACKRGTATCNPDGLGWGACEGEVLPLPAELCANGADDDCNGEIDDDKDLDGDGWGACAGDCCDEEGPACLTPKLVNPGAYEVVDNTVDDDCDGELDEVAVACDAGLKSSSAVAMEYAQALDLCTVTEEAPADPKDRTWGVISAKFSLADGNGSPAAASRSIRTDFGAVIKPQKFNSMAVLSSGNAADGSDIDPAFAAFEQGKNVGTTSPPPADWLAANNGKIPNPPGCPAQQVPAANDPVMLTLRLRVPTNAKSFAAKMYFFSAEYPEYVCSQYNDFFVALVDSQAEGNPVDKNVAVFDDGDTQWPIGVNLVKVADGLFTQCEGGAVGCKGVPGVYNGCKAVNELTGTGFDAFDASACNAMQKLAGGGTGWLTLRGNVFPGEIMEIRLAVWDTGGHIFDSLVLLDAWEWSLDAAAPGVTPG
ncbi:MAG: choice-of-anchor L domain-containing protein [Nannocystis sp.]|nr:choice-of-anchor L domain-containing protein [Nannocystis sp.]MBA3548148.1 choice-of-anchor L domain-containing protein [Nannocystis sp.]